MHRDISLTNILIYEKIVGKKIERVAFLCDWDACKFQEHMDSEGATGPRRLFRSVRIVSLA